MSNLNNYNNDELKQYITNYLQECEWYNPTKRTNNQFFCINPNHYDSQGTNPNMSYNPKKYECHCFNCQIHYDIFDIVALNELIPADEIELMKNQSDSENRLILNKYFKQAKQRIIQKYIDSGIEVTPLKEEMTSSDDSIRLQASLYNIAKSLKHYAYDYLKARNINSKLAELFGIYEEEDSIYFRNNDSSWNSIPCKKLLFEYNERHYSQRILLPDDTLKKLNKKRYYHAGERSIYLERILDNAKLDEFPMFICEGEIDSLSFYSIQPEKWNFGAIGLGSADCFYLLLNKIKMLQEQGKNLPGFKFILALDNDNAGKQGTMKLQEGLKEFGIKTIQFKLPEGIKDSNEYLMKNEIQFKEQCFYYANNFAAIFEEQSKEVKTMQKNQINNEGTKKESIQEQEGMTPAEYGFRYSSSDMIDRFKNAFDHKKDISKRKSFKTGFSKLDESLNRGIKEGLIVIGARSGTGKTAFVCQLVENLAMTRDYDILFFSLEMSKKELISRSLSRLSAILTANDLNWNDKMYLSMLKESGTSTSDFMEIDFYSAEEGTKKRQIQEESIEAFKTYSNHLFIIEGNGTINAEGIERQIQLHKEMTGKFPLVVIDYLQIMSKINERDSDIEKLDKNIMRLKQVSRNCHIPIILISSFNRNSYDEEAKEEAFKGSGGIEYSSDILLTIDFDYSKSTYEKTAEGRRQFVREQKSKAERSLVIDILKNRQNALPKDKIQLQFNSEYMIFYTLRNDIQTFNSYLQESAIQFQKENK